jgi:lysine 6-dehydrogenase
VKLLVLGGGAQGRVIAADLARALPSATVTVADLRAPSLPSLPNLSWLEADASDVEALARTMREHDLVVGALPSRFGYGAMQAAIAAKRNLVDVSFSAENPLTLDAEAAKAGVAILPDCGLAPGLSHLAVGRAAADLGTPDEVAIYVGGVAIDRERPYGYVVTWSLDDLLEEYVRPAKIVADGRPITVPVFSGLETIELGGLGAMEAFYSDGLRTLVETLPGVATMGEKTLRWPGHVAAIQPLLAAGRFVEEFRARCVVDEPRDLVVMFVRVRRGDRQHRLLLIDRYDAATRTTAMARTTALTTSAVALAVANGLQPTPGVQPLERVAREPRAYEAIVGRLGTHGIRTQWSSSRAGDPVGAVIRDPAPGL